MNPNDDGFTPVDQSEDKPVFKGRLNRAAKENDPLAVYPNEEDVQEEDLYQSHQVDFADNNYYYDDKDNAHMEATAKVFRPPRADYPEMPRQYTPATPNIVHKGRRNFHQVRHPCRA